jgi:hypothetical protein
MSTRFKSNSKYNYGQTPLPTGYENTAGTPDLHIPSCGVEDVDIAIFNLFDKEIVAECGGTDGAELKKVPVIFAAGEKWALLKRGSALRDRNNTLLIPLITIMRTEISQNMSDDVVGRGINQQVGEFVIRRRLDKSDRNYQPLINKIFLPNQDNIASTIEGEIPAPGGTTGQLRNSKFVRDGAYLYPNLKNNVYETIVVPTPQFYTAKYQVTVWTQYTQHANQIIEKIFSTFLPQGQSWRLDTAKGYWFVAKLVDGSLATETNFEDMSQQERFIKHTFDVSVPAYFFASRAPGVPVPIKRYVSSPTIDFTSGIDDPIDPVQEETKYELGSDDPTLPLDLQGNNIDSQRSTGWNTKKVYVVSQDINDPLANDVDPAASTLPRGGETVRVIGRNSSGETVYSGVSLGGLEIVVIK